MKLLPIEATCHDIDFFSNLQIAIVESSFQKPTVYLYTY